MPVLYIFAISHYCEKARWALDYLGVEYQLQEIAPGFHMRLARKYNLRATSLPVLVAGGNVIQGSSDIIDWAQAQSALDRTLTPPGYENSGRENSGRENSGRENSGRENSGRENECRELEARLDDIVGVHLRRFFYSEALVEYPEKVKPVFLNGIPWTQKLLLHAMWPRVRELMIKRMDLGPAQWEDSGRILGDELDWLDALLSDGREYLYGDTFTRADLTAASLLSRFVEAKEHPSAGTLYLPPRTEQQQREWFDRPAFVWIRQMYRLHRNQ